MYGDAPAEVLADLEGRHLHYLSARKVRTLAAEMGIEEQIATTSGQTIGPTAAQVKSETAKASIQDWPVKLAADVTRRLIRDGKVAVMPDPTQRYFAGRLYLVGGTLGAMDLKPPAAWFMGADVATAVMLCGSATHLRDRPSDETPTWYPSRLEDLSVVVRSIVASEEEDNHLGVPEFLAQPEHSHLETVRNLLHAIQPATQRGAVFMYEWADFLAIRHFVIPAFDLEYAGGYSQIVLGSPLWVASHPGAPPAGWYPDPQLNNVPGSARYWDGSRWTELCYTSGTQLFKPPPESPSEPSGWLPFTGRGRLVAIKPPRRRVSPESIDSIGASDE